MNNKEQKIIIRTRGIILHDNELLVVKHTPDADFYALPGGHLEYGENIHECTSRELVEELGVKPVIGRLLYVNNFKEENGTQSVEFFFEIINSSEYRNIDGLERTHAHEIFEMIWLKQSDDLNLLPKKVFEDFKYDNIISDQVRFVS